MPFYIESNQTEVVSKFNRKEWLTFLEKIAREYSIRNNLEIDVIAPWGFEVFDNDIYLSKNLRRFYCYFGLKCNSNQLSILQIENDLLHTIYDSLKTISYQFYKDFVVLLKNEEVILINDSDYECRNNDKALIVVVKDTSDILRYYARYVLSFVWQILYVKAEVENYEYLLVKRWRLFQLYLILESVFYKHLPQLNRDEQKLKKSIALLTDNQIWIFYNQKNAIKPMNQWERYAITFIYKRVYQIKLVLESGEDKIKVDLKDFHFDFNVSVDISKSIYESCVDHIIKTYVNFGYKVL